MKRPRFFHLRLAALLACGLAVLARPVATAATRDEIYNQAEADRNASRWDAAIAGYSVVLRTDFRNGHTWVRRAVCFNSGGRYLESQLDECRAHLAFVVAQDEKRARAIALTNRADSALAAKDYAGAFADAIAATKVDDTYGRAFLVVADAWYAVGNFAQANAFLADGKKREATLTRNYTADGAARNAPGKVQPDDAYNSDTDFNAALEAAKAKKYDEAVAAYDRLLARQPLNAGAWGNRGNQLRSLGRHVEAVISQSRAAALAAVLNLKPEVIARHFSNRLNSWIDLGDREMALLDASLALKVGADFARNWRQAAFAHFNAGELDAAREKFAEAQKRDPDVAALELDPAVAATHALARRARTGELPAIAELIRTAASAKTGLFQENTARTAALAVLDALLAETARDVELLVARAEIENVSASGLQFGTNDEALKRIDAALAVDPNHPRALLVRGLFRIDVVEVEDKALETAGYADLDRAIQLGAGTVDAFTRRAGHRSERKEFAGAIDDLTAALKLQPDAPDLLRQRAGAYEGAERWSDALADLDRLVALKPGDAPAVARRAESHLAAQNFPRAIADFDAALALDPKQADAYLGRARAHRLSGQRERAVADHRAARKLDTLLPELKADLANADEIEALRHDVKHTFARLAKITGEVSDATQELLKAERAKNRAEARLRRMLAGDDRTPEQILEEFDQAERDGDADATDHRDRARAFLKLDRLDEALAALDRSLALDDTHAATFNQRGRIHEARQEFDAAFADYDRAVTLEPKDADYRRDRGDVWWARKDFARALADYEEAVKLDGKNADNWFKRGNAHYMLAHFADAVADYDRALELDPKLKAAADNRAVARRRLGAP